MFKQLLTACVVSTMGFCSLATESTVIFTYAGDEAGYWGKGKSETYDVAIRINDPALAGKKIVGIRALINATEGVENTSLWLSKELTLETGETGGKVNVPDTYSENVEIKKIKELGVNCGELATTLSAPYELTEDGIYVGYTLEVPKADKLTAMQQNPLLLSPCDNPESLYIRASKDFLKWIPYNDRLNAAAIIYVTLEGEFPEYCIGIKNLESAYAAQNGEFSIKADLSNMGTQAAETLDYTYTINGGSHDVHFALEKPITTNFVSPTTVYLPIEAPGELGGYSLELTITKVNGQENLSSTATAATSVSVLPYVPLHRPLIEEFTGTWCGWCTRGFVALELLNETFGDSVVLAAYHSSDPMEVTSDFPVNVASFPSGSLNRNGVIDPYYGNYGDEDFGIKYDVIDCINSVAPADIQVEASWDDAEKTKINITTKTRFFENMENHGYKIGYLLINNGLTGDTPSWNQANSYSQMAGKLDGTYLEEISYWPQSVSGLTFNDVVVDVAAMKGVEGSIPENIVYNEENKTNYSINIAANKVIQDKEQLYVAAFIIAPNGTIMNANKTHVGGGSAVNTISSDASEVSAEYYNLAGSRVATPQAGIYVKVAKMSDGTVRTSKVVVR